MAQVTGLPEWFKEARGEACPAGTKAGRRGFVEKSLGNISSFMRRLFDTEESAARPGLLQSLDPRARIMGVFALMIGVSMAQSAVYLACAVAVTLLMARLSSVSLKALWLRVLPVFAFTSVIAVPLFFGSTGTSFHLYTLPLIGYGVWISGSGVSAGLFFAARASSMASLAALMALTTRQTDFFRGLRVFMPRFFVTALFMTFRYVFILLKTAEDAALARKSRTISALKLKESQAWFASRAALILERSVKTAEEVSLAMASRGFSGNIKTSRDGGMTGRDYLWVGLAFFAFFISFAL